MLFGRKRDKDTKTVKKGHSPGHGTSMSVKQAWEPGPAAADYDEEAAPASVAHSDTSWTGQAGETGDAILLTMTSIDQLEQASGQMAGGTFEGGWLKLCAGHGGRTVRAFPANEGDLFATHATIALIDPGQNNIQSRFFFGPIFFDADGNVLLWWKPFNKPDTKAVDVVVETRAPAGTATVKLGIHGSWDASGKAGDYIVGFANARLEKRSA
jgi:hypothetical protein